MKIEQNPNTGGINCVFQHDNNYYYADASPLPFTNIIECMIFHSDEDGNVNDWSELYCDKIPYEDEIPESFLLNCINEFKNDY